MKRRLLEPFAWKAFDRENRYFFLKCFQRSAMMNTKIRRFTMIQRGEIILITLSLLEINIKCNTVIIYDIL